MLNRTGLVRGLLGCMALATGTAHAGFITVDAVPYAGSTRSVAANNEFVGLLPGYGVTSYTLGTSLATDGAGTVEYFYYGKEAGYSNQFQAAGGAISHTTGFASLQNNFGAPLSLGSTAVGAGLLDFQFCAFTAPAASGNCITNLQNDTLRYEADRSIAMSIVGNSAWLFWDDSGAGPDDDYDDMVIRAVFKPASVPEPQTLALLAFGLLGVLAMRPRSRLRAAAL